MVNGVIGVFIGVLFFPLAVLLHIVGFRYVNVLCCRIGHLALEPDCIIKEQNMAHLVKRRWIILAPHGGVANEHLITYWEPYFSIIRNKFACFFIRNISRWGVMRHDIDEYARVLNHPQKSYKVYSEWGKRPPVLTLRSEDEHWFSQKRIELGLPHDAWFACVHVREGGFSPIDEELQSHRNSSIENTIDAMHEIIKRGGWVIRLGDPTMKPFPFMSNVIDYAHHPMKSDRLDVVLCAKARFILGSTSGICLVSSIFGVPAAIANMVPVADRWYGYDDISIPKKIWLSTESRHLGFYEAINSPSGYYPLAKQYDDNNLSLVESTPEEIRFLAVEMMDFLDGNPHVSDHHFDDSYKKMISHQALSYFSAARVANSFLMNC